MHGAICRGSAFQVPMHMLPACLDAQARYVNTMYFHLHSCLCQTHMHTQLFRFQRSYSLLQCLSLANLYSKQLSVRKYTCGSTIITEPTKPVYQQDGDKLLHPATILPIIPVSTLPDPDQAFLKNAPDIGHAIITNSTIFYVHGGDQPFDTGTMTSETPSKSNSYFEVKSVR
ncbi:hypothetical protein EAE96_003461 [Botrytis aclada]|nr:hypothetical protein EAE96_003461 [Botrytis aclada]